MKHFVVCSVMCIVVLALPYYLDASNIPGEKTCSSEGCTNCPADVNKCSDCKSGYKLNNTECIPCSSEGCTNCTADVNKCSDCKSGYKLNNTECIPTAPTTTTAASAVNLDSTSDASGTTPTHEHSTSDAPGTTPTHEHSTSDAPGTTPTHEHAGSCGRHFDVGSFFGGAALAAGIAVIIFFGCKFYKARSTPSYHQF